MAPLFRRGVTQLELMVAMALGLIVMLAATLLYVFVLRKLFWIEEATDRQLLAMQALASVRTDLRESSVEAVFAGPADVLALGVQAMPARGGERRWLAFPVVYANRAGTLMRLQNFSSPITSVSPPAWDPGRLEAALRGEGGWQRRAFRGCALGRVELHGDVVRFSVKFLQRRWDGSRY